MKLDPARFDTWFKALNNDKEPFPWQRRLFCEWLCPEDRENSRWPQLIKLPTASGKTAIIDLAVLTLASGSPCARRRIVFIVDRRVVVDEAALRAEAIRERLRKSLSAPSDPLYEISRSLLSIGGEQPLVVATLRGGIPDDDGWARSPAQPAVVLSTVDQAGSRLLFRAYGGHGPRSWPIHAGLLGRDTLMIVDEAHCAAPFCETAQAISDRWQHFAELSIGTGLALVRMSATPGESSDFELDDADRDDEILEPRLRAPKPAELVMVAANQKGDRGCLVESIVERTHSLLNSMTSGVVGVVINRVADARCVFEQVRIPDDRKVLLTGRVRGWERDRLLEKWLPRLRAGSRQEHDAPLAVIATQCIEVGANFDFDFLVTEIASLDALRQRFGRVDRVGERAKRLDRLGELAAVPGVIVATTAQLEEGANARFPDPVYGNALSRTWTWLDKRANGDPRCVDFGIDALESILPEGDELQHLCRDVITAYPLLPAHLDILAQTNPRPQPEPEISAFLHGTTRSSSDVTVVWRCDLPEDSPKAWPDRVAVQPPSTGEGCSVPIWDFRHWLAREGSSTVGDAGDVEGVAPEDEAGGTMKPVLRWRGLNDAKVLAAREISPGDTVVVPSSYGGCDQFGWNPTNATAVLDIGDAVAYASGRRAVLRLEVLSNLTSSLDASASTRLLLADLKKWVAGEDDAPDVSDALAQLASAEEMPGWLCGIARGLSKDQRRRSVEVSGLYAIVGRHSNGEDLGTAEDGSTLGVPIPLTDHCIRVRGYAKRFAKAVGLPKDVISDIALAAVLHDVGKADPRFQTWLHGGNEVAAAMARAPLAKSGENPRNRAAIRRARERSHYPHNARHEAQSLALIQNPKQIQERANDWDLVQHLVLTHHGFGRPFVPATADPNSVSVTLDYGPLHLVCTSDHRLHSLESGTVERYWRLTRRYGWWGLAWLETILRLADHRRSEDEERREVNGG